MVKGWFSLIQLHREDGNNAMVSSTEREIQAPLSKTSPLSLHFSFTFSLNFPTIQTLLNPSIPLCLQSRSMTKPLNLIMMPSPPPPPQALFCRRRRRILRSNRSLSPFRSPMIRPSRPSRSERGPSGSRRAFSCRS